MSDLEYYLQIEDDKYKCRPIFKIVNKLSITFPKILWGNSNRYELILIFAIGRILDALNKRDFKDKYSILELRKEINSLDKSHERPLTNIKLSELENDIVEYCTKINPI
jgi:hypothetical protein